MIPERFALLKELQAGLGEQLKTRVTGIVISYKLTLRTCLFYPEIFFSLQRRLIKTVKALYKIPNNHSLRAPACLLTSPEV